MRVSQVYRWQIPMDAGVVLRERRLKTRDGLFIRLQEGEREGWGEISPLPGFSVETLEEAQMALLAWAQAWRDGAEPPLPTQPSVAFGISCAQAELSGGLPQAADYRAAPLCSGDPDELFARLAAMPGEKVAKVSWPLGGGPRRHGGESAAGGDPRPAAAARCQPRLDAAQSATVRQIR